MTHFQGFIQEFSVKSKKIKHIKVQSLNYIKDSRKSPKTRIHIDINLTNHYRYMVRKKKIIINFLFEKKTHLEVYFCCHKHVYTTLDLW